MTDTAKPTVSNSNTISQSYTLSKTVELGKKLKSAREKQGLSISNISEQFFITSDIVRQIEDGNYDSEDLTIFLRGYIRHYANLVGVSESEVNAAFKSLSWQPIYYPKNSICKIDDNSCAGFIDGKQTGKGHFIGFILLIAFIGAVLVWHALRNDNETILTAESMHQPQQIETQIDQQQNSTPAVQENSTVSAGTQRVIKSNAENKTPVLNQSKTITNAFVMNENRQPSQTVQKSTVSEAEDTAETATKTAENSTKTNDSTADAQSTNESSQAIVEPNAEIETSKTLTPNNTEIKQESNQQERKLVQKDNDSLVDLPWRANL